MKVLISMSAKAHKAKSKTAKKKSSRSIFLKALMGRIDEDLAEAFASGDVSSFESQFEDLKKALVAKMK